MKSVLSEAEYRFLITILTYRGALQEIYDKFSHISPATIYSIFRIKGQESIKKNYLVYLSKAKEYSEKYFKDRSATSTYDKGALIQLAMNLSPNDLPAFLLSKILLAYCYNPKATILPNHGKDPFDAQLTLHLVDYLNSNELRRFMKWMQDFLIAEFSFEFFHLESYYNEDSIVANSVREMTPNGLERLLASYQENFPLVPMPEVLQDPILWQHVSETIIEDALCSPLAESYKHQIGKDMEVKLFDSLKAHKISYISEHELFKLGYPKTPDALLSVPVALPVPGGNGRSSTIINWIESKAFFGNVRQHEMYLQKQYWAYHNRYGPGLVIYWFGHVQELNSSKNKGVYVTDKFPLNFIKISPFPDALPQEIDTIFQ